MLPHHTMSQEVAERIWNLLAWEDLQDMDSVDPIEVDVAAKGWDCRSKIYH